MTGLVDGGFGASELWQAVKPLAVTNLVTNPSFEVSTAGWAATSGAITRVAGGRFGAWCGSLLASAANGRADFALPQATAGQPVTESVYFRADSPLVLLRLVQDAAIVEQAHPGDNLWHRVEVTATAATATVRSLRVIDTRTAAWTAVLIDGAQYEQGVVKASTHCDGDQDGCVWNGAAHLSTSTRDGRDGRGGAIVSLESLGFYTTQMLGIGAPPVDVGSQESALGDGELFQRSRNKPRVLTLMGTIFGTGGVGGLASLHTIRRGLMDVFRPDSRTNRGPITLRYSGAAVPKTLPAYYQSGLEMDGIEAEFEKIPLRLVSTNPDFVGETDEQTAITAAQSVTAAKIAHRTADGTWSGMGTGLGGAVTTGANDAVKLPDGRLVAGGDFADAGGVSAADNLAIWDGTTWAAFGTFGSAVHQMTVTAAGELWVVGGFTNANGDANQDYVAVYNIAAGTWSAKSTGANDVVYAAACDPTTGYVWVTGNFTSIGGVACSGCAYWNGSGWVDADGGIAISVGIRTLSPGPNGAMYRANHESVMVWNGTTWVSIGALVPANPLGGAVGRLAYDGTYLYVYGPLPTSVGGVAVGKIGRWNGSGWQALGIGAAGGASIETVAGITGGGLAVAGFAWSGTIGGIVTPDSIAVWNGSGWEPFPADPPDTGTHVNDRYRVFTHPDGSLTMAWLSTAGTFAASLSAPGSQTVTNSGSSMAYPIITIASTALIYWIKNLTTGHTLKFNGLSGAINGTITIDFRPARKTVRNGLGTNLIGSVVTGSDLATFCLAPGDNVIKVYVSGTVTGSMRWRPQFWSAD